MADLRSGSLKFPGLWKQTWEDQQIAHKKWVITGTFSSNFVSYMNPYFLAFMWTYFPALAKELKRETPKCMPPVIVYTLGIDIILIVTRGGLLIPLSLLKVLPLHFLSFFSPCPLSLLPSFHFCLLTFSFTFTLSLTLLLTFSFISFPFPSFSNFLSLSPLCHPLSHQRFLGANKLIDVLWFSAITIVTVTMVTQHVSQDASGSSWLKPHEADSTLR